jgi:hypothetical protein
MYPGSFLMPAALATRQLGDEDLAKAVANRSFWKLAMYAWTFMEFERQSPMWGVGSGKSLGKADTFEPATDGGYPIVDFESS